MTKTCPVCTYAYHTSKSHCPTCGNEGPLQNSGYYGIKLHTIVVAHGAIRQEHMGTRRLHFTGLCDPDQ